ncbi:unnamed protein product, partial [Meganyctiphanes norvegica]
EGFDNDEMLGAVDSQNLLQQLMPGAVDSVDLLQKLMQQHTLTNSHLEELELEQRESLIEQRDTNALLHNIVNINSLMVSNGHLVLLPRAQNASPMNWTSSVERCARHNAAPLIPRTHHDLSWLFHLCESIWEPEGIWLPAKYSSHLDQYHWIDGNDAADVLGKFLLDSHLSDTINKTNVAMDMEVSSAETTDGRPYADGKAASDERAYNEGMAAASIPHHSEDYCVNMLIKEDLSRTIKFRPCVEAVWPMVCVV